MADALVDRVMVSEEPQPPDFQSLLKEVLEVGNVDNVHTEGTKARSLPLTNQEFRQGP